MILSCSGTIGTCCTDGGLVVLIDMTRSVLNIIQIVVPILLTVWAAWGFLQMTINPDTKNGLKKIFNKFVAAIIVFLIPAFVNFTLGLMPETFSLNACWKQAKNKAELARQESKYINPYEDQKTTPIYSNPDGYDPSEKSSSDSSIPTGAGAGAGVNRTGTAQEQQLIAYAMKWLGKPYKYGGSWNGEEPWTPTDCVGFIRGVYRHFGYKIPGSYTKIFNYKNVTNGPLRAGDIVVYEGHWAMLTGNGNEIIQHTRKGVKIGKDYTKSKRRIKGIVRILN